MQPPMDSHDPAGVPALVGLTLRRQLDRAAQADIAARAGMTVPQFMRHVETLRRRGLLRVTTAFDAGTGAPVLELDLGPALTPLAAGAGATEGGGRDDNA